jgi:alkanesulfonate monooxygenase SsuD/methylene tetrahydromethanopterin reductase-like flavin-dependent oxidoreductase (luciferase family)
VRSRPPELPAPRRAHGSTQARLRRAHPDDYVEEVQQFNRLAEEAGNDPDDMTRLMLFAVVPGDTEEQVEEMLRNPLVRWDAAAPVPGGNTWKRHGLAGDMG